MHQRDGAQRAGANLRRAVEPRYRNVARVELNEGLNGEVRHSLIAAAHQWKQCTRGIAGSEPHESVDRLHLHLRISIAERLDEDRCGDALELVGAIGQSAECRLAYARVARRRRAGERIVRLAADELLEREDRRCACVGAALVVGDRLGEGCVPLRRSLGGAAAPAAHADDAARSGEPSAVNSAASVALNTDASRDGVPAVERTCTT